MYVHVHIYTCRYVHVQVLPKKQRNKKQILYKFRSSIPRVTQRVRHGLWTLTPLSSSVSVPVMMAPSGSGTWTPIPRPPFSHSQAGRPGPWATPTMDLQWPWGLWMVSLCLVCVATYCTTCLWNYGSRLKVHFILFSFSSVSPSLFLSLFLSLSLFLPFSFLMDGETGLVCATYCITCLCSFGSSLQV